MIIIVEAQVSKKKKTDRCQFRNFLCLETIIIFYMHIVCLVIKNNTNELTDLGVRNLKLFMSAMKVNHDISG